MKVFTNGERGALLAATVSVPAKPALAGWGGYSLVVYTRAPADRAWRVESSKSVGHITERGTETLVCTTVYKCARRLGLPLPVTLGMPEYAMPHGCTYDDNAKWWCAQAWATDAHGNDVVLACVFPDIVWGTHFPEARGPFVAIVHWPPGSNNNHALCVVRSVCLGADAWTHLDAAVADFRARVAFPSEAHESSFSGRVDIRGTVACTRGANVYACMTTDYGLEESTWSAELFASVLEDSALRALACASKQ